LISLRLAALAAFVLTATAAAAGSSPGWETAHPGYTYAFPADFGAHESFRDEWWYYSGNVRDTSGRRFGFELTMFRYGVEHPLHNASAWDINDLYFAHFALTDVTGHRFIAFDRTERAALGLGGAASGDERTWAGDWHIARSADGRRFIRAGEDGVNLDLTLTPSKDPVAEGQDGAFHMGGCATCYARYYSFTRLRAAGSLTLRGQPFAVTGTAWHDHEWGSNYLEPTLAGWDWFSVQLGNGVDVMIFRFRRPDGSTLPQSSGTFVDRSGSHHFIAANDFDVVPTNWWISPHDGARYPSGWTITLRAEHATLTVTPLLVDQELSTSHSTQVTYWEGACSIAGTLDGKPVDGVGYAELTGYAPGGSTDVR
jgi:predicted secreted hydrolase